MGRHASGPEPVLDRRTRWRGRLVVVGERLALGAGAGAVTALVLWWAGVAARTAGLVGLAALVVVPLLAWIAASVPPHPHASQDEVPGSTTRRSRG
jgi:fatty acid desaturase